MKDNVRNTRKIALNGVLGALAVICVLLAAVLPTNKLSLYALSSFFAAVVITERGIRAGLLFYVATSLLSLIIVPEKIAVIPYSVFFGMYGIVKYYIEKLDKLVLEYILKFIYFNICMGIAGFTVSRLFEVNLPAWLPWWALIVLAEIVFFIYDFVYTLFIGYYRDKLKPKMKLK